MAVALSVFSLVGPLSSAEYLRDRSSRTQLTLVDAGAIDGLPAPHSELNFVHHDGENDRVTFQANHYTDTIDQEIRVFLDEQRETSVVQPGAERRQVSGRRGPRLVSFGYQEVYRFPVIIDFRAKEIYVYTTKDVARAFMRRFKKSGRIDYAPLHFDLGRIDEAERVKNVIGAWASNLGRVTTIAFYGTEVHRDLQVKQREVKCYNVLYTLEDDDDDEGPVDLYIGAACSLSSRSQRVNDGHLLDSFESLKLALGVTPLISGAQAQSK